MIAVRDFTNGSDVLSHAAEIRRKFYPSRQMSPTQVVPDPEEALSEIITASTRKPHLGSRGTSPEISKEVEALRKLVLSMQAETKVLRSEIAELKAEIGIVKRVEEGQRKPLPMSVIRALVVSEFQIHRTDLESPRRDSRCVKPRQALMWLLRQYTTSSLPEIGRFMGGRDHTTIMHGCNCAETLMASDPFYRAKIEAVEARINAEMGA